MGGDIVRTDAVECIAIRQYTIDVNVGTLVKHTYNIDVSDELVQPLLDFLNDPLKGECAPIHKLVRAAHTNS
jgi:hypothetical protein